MTSTRCAACDDAGLAALAAAVADDDLDAAIEQGLLAFDAPAACCAACAPRIATVLAARDVRLHALAARERFRARQTRLAERAEAKARRRAAATPAQGMPAQDMSVQAAAPALPSAAQAALARAKARAAAKRSG
jgi:hypothetical protein